MDVSPLESQKHLFWDIDHRRIPFLLKNSPEWVIPRILEYGELDDIDELQVLYDLNTILRVIHTEPLGRVARVMAGLYYDDSLLHSKPTS